GADLGLDPVLGRLLARPRMRRVDEEHRAASAAVRDRRLEDVHLDVLVRRVGWNAEQVEDIGLLQRKEALLLPFETRADQGRLVERVPSAAVPGAGRAGVILAKEGLGRLGVAALLGARGLGAREGAAQPEELGLVREDLVHAA